MLSKIEGGNNIEPAITGLNYLTSYFYPYFKSASVPLRHIILIRFAVVVVVVLAHRVLYLTSFLSTTGITVGLVPTRSTPRTWESASNPSISTTTRPWSSSSSLSSIDS